MKAGINQACSLKRTLSFDFEGSQRKVKHIFLNPLASRALWNSLYLQHDN